MDSARDRDQGFWDSWARATEGRRVACTGPMGSGSWGGGWGHPSSKRDMDAVQVRSFHSSQNSPPWIAGADLSFKYKNGSNSAVLCPLDPVFLTISQAQFDECRARFLSQVASALLEIERGNCSKLVPFATLTLRLDDREWAQFQRNFPAIWSELEERAAHSCQAAGDSVQPLWAIATSLDVCDDDDDRGSSGRGTGGTPWVWVGLTPEFLLQIDSAEESGHSDPQTLRTMAVAGTRRVITEATDFGATATAPTDVSEKEYREHQSVVDELLARLTHMISAVEETPLSTGAVKKPRNTAKITGKTRWRRAGALWHLVTPIAIEFANHSSDSAEIFTQVSQWVEALHPSPALGGAPMGGETVRKWLKENDEERGAFGAPISLRFTNGEFLSLVMIRGVEIRPEQQCLVVRAGCGVVAGSVPAEEWDEAWAKLQSTLINFHMNLQIDPLPRGASL